MSQRTNILRWLKRGYTLTPLQALRHLKCLSLSQRIGELKRHGHCIKTEMVRVGDKRVAKYSLTR